MTTIAYRDGILAADSQSTTGNLMLGRSDKIILAGDFVLAMSGKIWCQKPLTDWLANQDGTPDTYPKELITENGKDFLFDAFVLKDGQPFEIINGHLIPLKIQYHACGSGWEVAVGAMAGGASALEAVKITATVDVYTSGPYSTYNVKTGN